MDKTETKFQTFHFNLPIQQYQIIYILIKLPLEIESPFICLAVLMKKKK